MTFDLEKARDLAANPIRCPETDEVFRKAMAEIERLRAENREISKAVIDISNERDLAQAEFRAYHKAWEQQTDRIKELEAEAQEYHDRAEELAGMLAKSWRITEERKAAVEHLIAVGCGYGGTCGAISILRTMLTEAGQ